MYSRVDVLWDNDNEIALSEIELIEPELWFRNNPEAATLMAEEISKLVFKAKKIEQKY